MEAGLWRRDGGIISKEWQLKPVVGIDVEAEDGINFDWLLASSYWAEFPVVEGCQYFAGHDRGSRLQHMRISYQA